MPGILALLSGKSKGMGKGMGMGMESSEAASPEDSYAREAFAAIKDDDEAGFVEAFKMAVRACSRKSDAGEYESEDEETEL